MALINSSKSWFKSVQSISLVVLGFIVIIIGALVSRSGMGGGSTSSMSTHFFNTAQADTPHDPNTADSSCDHAGCYADEDGDGEGDCQVQCQTDVGCSDCGYSS